MARRRFWVVWLFAAITGGLICEGLNEVARMRSVLVSGVAEFEAEATRVLGRLIELDTSPAFRLLGIALVLILLGGITLVWARQKATAQALGRALPRRAQFASEIVYWVALSMAIFCIGEVNSLTGAIPYTQFTFAGIWGLSGLIGGLISAAVVLRSGHGEPTQ